MMDHRTRFMNCLRGQPIDRLPFIEICGMPWCWSPLQAWDKQGIHRGTEPRSYFGFDCADVPEAVAGYEVVPIDWYAVPRFPEYELPDDGPYRRRIDGRWGQTRHRLLGLRRRTLVKTLDARSLLGNRLVGTLVADNRYHGRHDERRREHPSRGG